jgi:hypothetical protein
MVMFNVKRTVVALGAAATMAVGGLTPALAAQMSSGGCVEYNNNTCTKWQVCTLDTSTNHGSCSYSYVIRGRWVEVYSEAF